MQAFSKTSMAQMILLSPIIKTLLVSGCPKFSNRIQLGPALAACSFIFCFVETTFEWWHQPGLTVSDTFSFLKEHNEKVRRAETKTIADETWNKVTTRWEGPRSLSYHKQSLSKDSSIHSYHHDSKIAQHTHMTLFDSYCHDGMIIPSWQ